MSASSTFARVGLVVHPTRDVDRPRQDLLGWANSHGVDVLPLELDQGRDGEIAPEECDLVMAIGGDGTTLAAIRRAANCGRPVLGVACGSLGALTTVEAEAIPQALDRFAGGDWQPREIPALQVRTGDGEETLAFNDIALVRESGGQLRVTARLDGTLFTRLAGDGVIISTAVGSSAYTIAAGGPLLDPGLAGFVLTPLPTHGGFSPPLVVTADATLELEVTAGHSGGRLEIDGRGAGEVPSQLTVRLAPAAVTIVAFSDQESHLTGLRRRGIITDSPRILAEDQRG